jgi:hypothetical protein
MHVQEREVRKNYIGIVCDRTEEQRAIASVSHSTHLMRDYVRGLMAALFSRRNKTAWAFRVPPPAPAEMQNGISELP